MGKNLENNKKNNLGKLNISFILNSIYCFIDFRGENLKVFNNFFNRLDFLISNSKQIKKPPKVKTLSLQKFLSGILLVLRQFLQLPKYIIQIIRFRNLRSEEIGLCQAYCVASRRLDFDFDDKDSFSHQIKNIMEAFGDKDPMNLFPEHPDSKKISILYDAEIESGLWRFSFSSHNHKLFIFDGAFLIFFSIVLLVKGLFFRSAQEFIFLRRYLNKSKDTQGKYTRALYIRIVEALTFIAYDNIINKLPKHSTILLTCNAYFTELLRVYILQNVSAGNIIEVLHGAIANSSEVWYQRLLSYNNEISKKRHFLIPHVPNLPELDILNNKYFVENNLSINTYLNSHLYINKKTWGSYKAYALNNLKKLNLNPQDRVLTCTYYGGTGIREEFFMSSGFKVETRILYKIISYFSKKKININIIYVPHPKNKLLPPNVSDMFKKLSVHVFDVSLFTYFITDYSVSNMSSCLLETKWLGVECFSPMIEADDIYSKNYLETIHHPVADGKKALDKALHGFIKAGFVNGSMSYMEKFNMRLKIIKGQDLD
jgi:hypothetical protein